MTGFLFVMTQALAGPLPDAEEFIATYGTEPPNVLFVLDTTEEMLHSCGSAACIDTIVDALQEVSHHTPWANLGLAGTTITGHRDWTPLSAIGEDRDALRAALASMVLGESAERNLAETLSLISRDYLLQPSSATYAEGDFDEGPFCVSCQETHIVVITAGHPYEDEYAVTPVPGDSVMSYNVRCDETGVPVTSGPDSQCLYDNIVWLLYNRDHASLAGQQSVTTHTIYVSPSPSPDAVALYQSARLQTDYWGSLTIARDSDAVRASIANVMEWIRWPLAGRSAPVLHADGDRLLYSDYRAFGHEPLHQGHLRAYAIGSDEADPVTLGQVVYDDAPTLDGALWDAGELLSHRPVHTAEYNEDNRDGMGRRDLYTFLPELAALGTATTAATEEGRHSFDRSLVELLRAHPAVASHLMPLGDTGPDLGWDLDGDDAVTADDYQVLVDFTRGVTWTKYRHLWRYRGEWRLGDAPRGRPAVIRGRSGSYSADPAYRRFLKMVSQNEHEVVLHASNAGMLHAFDLDTGRELWGWIPSRLLYLDRDHPSEGRLIDVIRFGRQRLLEGSVTVDDVWIDADNDGEKLCDDDLSTCEWRRVALVSQGRGGPAVLALDVTDPTAPTFLWEQVDVDHPNATGYGSQSVVVVPMQDGELTRWTALWGAGLARRPVEGHAAQLSEPTVYARALDDTYAASPRDTFAEQAATGRFPTGGLAWPDASGSDLDSDGRPEQATVASPPAAVDLDDDGTVDIAYVHVTDLSSPEPSSVLYKLRFGDDPADPEWCQMYDATATAGITAEVTFSPTASWMLDGTLALFWGTGGAMTGRSDETGTLFGIRDIDPWGCAEPRPICGTDGAKPMSAGARLTDKPVIYNGTVYFASWSTDPAGCGAGSGRIYGLRYDTCAGALTDPDSGLIKQDFVQVSTYPSALTFSDQGRLLIAVPNSTRPISSLPTGDPMQGTELISHMFLQ